MSLFQRIALFVATRRLTTGILLAIATVLAWCGNRYVPPVRQPGGGDEASQTAGRFRVASEDLGRRAADCFLVIDGERLFTPRGIAAVRAVAERLKQLHYVDSLIWVDTVPQLNVFGLAEPLLPPSDASEDRVREATRRALEHPLVRGQLAAEDGRTLLMPVHFDWLYVTSDAECSEVLLAAARETAAQWPDVDMRIRATGRVPLYLAYKSAFDRNHWRFTVISYVLVFGLSWILFRGLRPVLVVAAGPVVGIYWTTGLLQWLDELSNPLTNVVLPVLLMMVGLTDGIHLLMHIRRERATGASPVEAAKSGLREVGLACLLTSLTTAIGFGSLMLAQSKFVRGFGLGCGIGVLFTFVSVIVVIPWLCSTWMGDAIHVGYERDIVGRGLQRYRGWIDWIIRHARAITWISVSVTLALTGVALTLRPDDRLKDSQPTGSEAYEALRHCDTALGGIDIARVVVEWDEDSQLDDARRLSAIQDVERLVAAEPSLHYPLSILNVLSSLPGDESVESRAPFLELLPKSVRRSYFDSEARRAVLTVRIQDLGIAHYEPIFRRVEAGLADIAAKNAGLKLTLSGEPVSRGRNLHRIVTDLAASLGSAALIIFVVLAIAFRSLRLGLIAVIPNVFPLAVTAAVMLLLDHPLEIASVCSFTVCLGIAVDDTIHYMSRYREEIARGCDVPTAVRRAFEGVGAAMIVTTVVLLAGFASVLLSELPGHRYFSAMAVSTIAAALIGDLLILPAMLVRFAARPPR